MARYFGILAVLMPMVVYMYYVYIEAWCLRYAWEYLIGGIQLSRPDHGSNAERRGIFRARHRHGHGWRSEYERGFLAHRGLDQYRFGLSRIEGRDRKILPVRAPGDGLSGGHRPHSRAHPGHAESRPSRTKMF